MTLLSKMQIGLLVAGGLLVAWEFQQHLRQGRELVSAKMQVQAQQQELDSRRPALDALEQRNRELQEAEKRAGNQRLLSLLRERNVATLAANQTAAETHAVGSALAKTLDSPEHQEADREYLRSQIRADQDQFYKLLNLPPEKINQYVDLQVEMERRKNNRVSALLHGRIAVADALRERDNDEIETERRRHEILGDEGLAFWNGIADGMRNDEAKRQLKIIQQNMGDNKLNREQSDLLQALIKNEIVTVNMDDIELFRPPEEWTQLYVERLQKISTAIAPTVTPAQLETLKTLGAYDLAERQKQMAARRTSLGIK